MAFGPFGSNKVVKLKQELLSLAKQVDRGLTESSADNKNINQLFTELEKCNKFKSSLKSPLVNGVWELQYTTSDTILGRGSNPRIGKIIQVIDAINGFAENKEVVRYFGFIDVPRSVTAEITPVSESKVDVLFKRFTIGPFTFSLPVTARGALDITYIDEDLRLSRGDKGNIFVLTRLKNL